MTSAMDRSWARDAVPLFVIGGLVLAAGAIWGLPAGKAIAGALVILDGGVPYRDFWTMYAPGQFYTVAALYALFGREVLVQAVATAIVRAASAVVFLRLLRRLGAGRRTGLVVSTIFLLMFWETAPELTDYPLALPLILLGIDRMVRYFGGGGTGHLGWAGCWFGLAAWFKHDVAAYFAIGSVVSLYGSSWLLPARPGNWATPHRGTMRLAGAAAAALAPVALWTAWTAGAAAWNDLFVFPATVFSKVRGDRFPPIVPDLSPLAAWLSYPTHVRRALLAVEPLATWVVLYAPAVMFAGGAGLLIAARRQLDPAAVGTVVLSVASMPFFWAAAHVQHNTHPYSLAILGACIGVVAWTRTRRPGRSRAVRVAAALGLAVYAAGLTTDAGIKAAATYYQWKGSRVLDLPGLRGVRLPDHLYESYRPVGEYVRTHVPAGEPIYTGLARHDSIVINNSLLYAIAGRPACCGYTELHPGVGDRAPVHRAIIQRLEQANVRTVVLWAFGWPDEVMAARKRHTMAGVPDAGSTLLDEYIAAHFVEVARHGEYRVLRRNDARRPASATGPTAR